MKLMILREHLTFLQEMVRKLLCNLGRLRREFIQASIRTLRQVTFIQFLEVRTRKEGNGILHTKDTQNQREVEEPKSDPLYSGLQSELQTEIHTEKDQGSASKSKHNNSNTCDSCLMTSKVTNTDGVSAAAVDGFQHPTEMEQQALRSSVVVSKKAIEHDTNVGLQKESSTSVCIKASEPSGLASFEKEISITEAKIRQLVVCKHEYISSGVKTGESFASSKMKDRSMCTEITTAYCAYGENIKEGAGTTLETKHTKTMTKQFQVTNDKVTNVPNEQAAAGREENDTIQGNILQECDFKDNMTKEEGQCSGLVMESPNMPSPLKHSKTCPVQLNRYEVGKEKVPDSKPAGSSSESDTQKNAAMNLGGVNCNSTTSAAETVTGNKPSDIPIRSTESEERKSENAQASPYIEIKMHLDRLNSVTVLQHEKPRREGEVKVIDDCPPPPAPFPHHVVSLKSAPPSSFYSINLRQVIGGGRFGHVHKCTEKSSGLKLAAKSIKVRCPKDKELVLHEVQTMNQLNHPNLIQLYDAFEYKNDITLIMEYLEGGELFEKIIDEDYRLTELEVMVFVKQICEGIHYMHQMYVLHLDLKPENILCVSQAGNQVKIIDFGLARRYKPREKLKVSFGTPEFLAPEIVNFDFVSFPSDMWSLGVITYMLLSGLSPFMGEDDTETLNNVLTANWSFDEETFKTVTEEAKDFVSNLLIKEKSGRLSAAQCLRHPWLKNIVETARNNNVLLLSQIQLRKYMMKRLWKKNFIAVAAANRFQKISSSGSLFTMGI
ncbi:myosin light chain kinase 2, skeletal/cardiac muscle isoform X2 [Protopterus annectens]|uniref:myosin light chain kinase 2, skeletal/cardiac muscle isoform X2 n=1 Tax=Protopterus annectens TaxID=7888 RepID=UPI001CFB5C57|nr:myosin light chain kinase 2, skeletal/cardiac muscle isoform X2 [Protopterus annectens]